MEVYNRINESNVDVRVAIRFLRLDKFQALTLEREIIGAFYQQSHEGSFFIGSVPLRNELIDDINTFYVRQQVDLDDCDIFISVESGYSEKVIEVPAIVNQFLKHIDCRLAFSYRKSDLR